MWSAAPWADEAALAAAWRAAEPFPHLILDDVVAAGSLDALMAVLDDEPVEHYESDIFAFDATAPEPTTAAFRAVRETFAEGFAPVLSRVTGRAVERADMRAFAYRPGDHLLPHTDHQTPLGRVLAYAYYLPTPAPPVGGELELYRCALTGAELGPATSGAVIAPLPNRLVLFEVGATSLHQVREVLDGLRLSLAGWFYA